MEPSKEEIILKAMGELGLDLTSFPARFDTRLRFQKYIYIFQSVFRNFYAGDFSLYLRGPYSSDVAKLGYDIHKRAAELKEQTSCWEFNKRAKEMLQIMRDLFAGESNGLTQNDKLEAYTTYRHLKGWYFGEKSSERAQDELFRRKKQFEVEREKVENFIKKVEAALL